MKIAPKSQSEEFLNLQENLEDLKDLREAKEEDGGEPSISLDEVKKLFGL